jgi:hypothetical protein
MVLLETTCSLYGSRHREHEVLKHFAWSSNHSTCKAESLWNLVRFMGDRPGTDPATSVTVVTVFYSSKSVICQDVNV